MNRALAHTTQLPAQVLGNTKEAGEVVGTMETEKRKWVLPLKFNNKGERMSVNCITYSWDLTPEGDYQNPKSLDFSIYLGKTCFVNLIYEVDGTMENVLADEMDIRQLKCLYNMLRSVFESYEIGTFKLETREKK